MIISSMDARSWYDSLQVSWRRQYGKGLTAAVFYTLGKAIDEASPTNTTLEVSGGPMIRMDSDDLRLDKGLGVFDVRQNLSGSFLWKPPLGRGSGSVSVSVLNTFVRDWQIGGFLTLASGHPFTPLISFNNSRNGVSGASAQADRPNMRPGYEGNVVIGKVEKWYEPRAFELPQVGFFGNLGRNTIPGPGFYDFDLVVSRDFRTGGGALSESLHLQFRAEFFNVLNHPNFDLPGGSVSAEAASYVFTDSSGEPNPAAAQLTRTSGNPRQLQIGLKVLW